MAYRVVHVGEVGRRDAGVFRRVYSSAEVEALRTRPDDDVVYEDGDTTFTEVWRGGYDPDEMREWMTDGAGVHLAGEPDSGDAPVDLLPPPGAPVSVLRNVRLPYEVDSALEAAAHARGTTVSELIREAIDALLAAEADGTPDPVVALRLTLAAARRAVDRLAAEHPEAA